MYSIWQNLACLIEHLDELADLLIGTGIAPDLTKVQPGVWRGKVDIEHTWAHDETPQFINYKWLIKK